MKTITPSEALARKKQSSALFLDVRTPPEIRQAGLNGSTCVPHQKVARCPELDKVSRDEEIILVCQSGKRAEIAAEKLANKGFSNLSIMEGGMNAWLESNLPCTKGQEAISLERQVRIAAGILVALGCLLTFFGNPAWIIVPAFVGCGLVFAGLTDSCGMGLLIAKMPWNQR